MTITLDVPPEVQAELARQAAEQGRAIESVAVELLEEAVRIPARGSEPGTGQALIDAFAEIRGLLTDEEVDRMFRRNPSAARPVDLS